jgi:ParB-like chromosome segregation protein Spo0J
MEDHMELAFHPLADIFPLMEGEEFDGLVQSVKEGGLLNPITVHDDAILDGRNRYRACLAAGVKPITKPFDGKDPVQFVLQANLHRRHLKTSQRSMVAAKIAALHAGGDRRSEKFKVAKATLIDQSEAATLLNVSRHSVMRARVVLERGTEEEKKAVETGTAAVNKVHQDIRAREGVAYKASGTSSRKKKNAEPVAARGKNPERIENQRVRGAIWSALKDALISLTSLPTIEDVVPIIRAYDRSDLVSKRLPKAIKVMEELSHVYNEKLEARNHDGDAGAGDAVAGTEQTQSAH